MRVDVRLRATTLRAILGWVLLMLSVAGCAESVAPAPAATAQQTCERAGGTWRGTRCETPGGY